jgi:hypothetical protein
MIATETTTETTLALVTRSENGFNSPVTWMPSWPT